MSEVKCPIDHSTRSKSIHLLSPSPSPSPPTPPQPGASSGCQSTTNSASCTAPASTEESDSTTACPATPMPPTLSTGRETSSIPRTASENWVYPSEAQFFAAMTRKRLQQAQGREDADGAGGAGGAGAGYPLPRASDMRVIVPIHNAVNERTWAAVKDWEAGRGGERCGGPRLVSFRGRPGDRSPKAWAKVMVGYTPPFDRHDWVIDRCGVQMRYIIDFYTGRADPSTPHHPSFYIDARPALDSWEGVKMRAQRFWEHWIGDWWSPSAVKAPHLDGKNGSE